MIVRIVSILGFLGVLFGLIVYSQYRREPSHVSGYLESDEIRVGSRLGGRVAAVHVDEGDAVAAGEVLVDLEPYDVLEREQEAIKTLAVAEAELDRLRAGFRDEEIAQAKARRDQAQARYDKLIAGPREEEIDAARARKQMAQSELALAGRSYERSKRLHEQDALSDAEFDSASESFEAAQSGLEVREQELNLLLAGSRKEDIAEAQAQLDEATAAWRLSTHGYRTEDIRRAESKRDAARAALQVIREQKKELQIRSPIDGVVEAMDLQKGDLVPAGGPVLSLMDVGHLWVRAFVPQNRVGLRVGDALSVTVDAFPDQTFRGVVTFVARQAEFTPNNVQTPEERSKQVFRIKVTLREATVGTGSRNVTPDSETPDSDTPDSETPESETPDSRTQHEQAMGRLRSGMTADVWLGDR